MIPLSRHPSRTKGFTLVEIIVVASLIAILSGMATMGWLSIMRGAKRKASFGDLRTLAHATSRAHMDVGIYPKLCYLYLPRQEMELDYNLFNTLPPHFEATGHTSAATLSFQSKKILGNWRGAYFTNPLNRNISNPGGVGYVVNMKMPGTDNDIRKWPADPWGNPYVVYLVNISTEGGQTRISWINTPFEKPNYKAIVVGYGRNKVPGGFSDIRRNQAFLTQAMGYRLYRQPIPNVPNFEALTFQEMNTPVRFNAISNQAPLTYLGPNFPGIMDPGSDDVWFEIP